MNNKNKIENILLAVAFVFVSAFTATQAQTTAPQTQTQDNAQTTQTPNLQEELNLTPEQIQRWRALNRELREQQVSGTVRLREARRALTDAMESPTPNEELIKQRAKDLADAQSVMTQLQALRQARVLQILTPEQRVKLKTIQAHTQELKRENRQQGVNALNQRQQMKRNASAPLLTPAQRRALKRQQKQKP